VGLIEQAAKRLEELKRAGIDVPAVGDAAAAGPTPRAPTPTPSVPERAMRSLTNESAAFRQPGQSDAPAPADAPEPAQAPPPRRSKLVEINLEKLAAAGYVTPTAPRSQLADEMRVIKRPLLSNAQGKSAAPIHAANMIMVTSALPGEGKTFTAINLAISIAMELDTTVLLVDADVARPAIPERLGVSTDAGLLDLLTRKDIDVADVLMRTNIERLSILPAGTPHSRATELLASEAMARLLEELAGHYPDRVLLFDAPPLLSSTESRVLATHMGQVVLVVEADRTPQSSVKSALDTIEACPVVMTVLNKIERAASGAYYGGYGGYGYGYGYGS
jgi:exopolysaccharide/PEP-CTERM locus tyrosine autokinase